MSPEYVLVIQAVLTRSARKTIPRMRRKLIRIMMGAKTVVVVVIVIALMAGWHLS